MRATLRRLSLLVLGLSACGAPLELPEPPRAPPYLPPPPAVVAPAVAPRHPEAPRPAEPPKPTMLEVERAAIASMLSALNAHDPARVAAAYTPDAVLTTPGAVDVKGREAIAGEVSVMTTAFPDLRAAPTREWFYGDVAVVELAMNGTHDGPFHGIAATGKPVGLMAATVFWFSPDGLVAASHRYLDGATLLAQIGALHRLATRPIPELPTGEPEVFVGGPGLDEVTAVPRALYDALAAKDDGAYARCLDDSFTWSDMTQPRDVVGTRDQKKAFAAFTRALPDLQVQMPHAFAVESWALVESVMTGTQRGPLGVIRPTNRGVTVHTLDLFEVKGGKAVRGVSYGNGLELLTQLGIHPLATPVAR